MNRGMWGGMLIACFLMLLVLAGAYPFLEPSSPSFVALQIAAIHLVVAIVIIATLLYFDWSPLDSLMK